MITYIQSDLFYSPAQTLVNTVNTEGVMGKGIAKTFKEKYPQMFEEYKKLCDDKTFDIGNLYLWRSSEKWVLNFPTKTTWRKPSSLDYVRKGLAKFCDAYEQLGIISISFPQLGCGNGQLDWSEVRLIMEEHLSSLPIQVFIHEMPVGSDFVPEHVDADATIPASFESFLKDIRQVLHKEKCRFTTLTNSSEFDVLLEGEVIKVVRKSGTESIPLAAVRMAWSTLQTGVLSIDQFGDKSSSRYKSYLFPILARLPYVTVTRTSNSFDAIEKHALLLRAGISKTAAQRNLWQSR